MRKYRMSAVVLVRWSHAGQGYAHSNLRDARSYSDNEGSDAAMIGREQHADEGEACALCENLRRTNRKGTYPWILAH